MGISDIRRHSKSPIFVGIQQNVPQIKGRKMTKIMSFQYKNYHPFLYFSHSSLLQLIFLDYYTRKINFHINFVLFPIHSQMQIQLNNIDFLIAVNTFSDDVQDKLQILTKLQLQFLRKFQHRVQIAEYHSQMVFEIRRIVSKIEEMYKDVRDYFVQMKVQFVYDFIRKIQTLMVIGYNHLSQALLITLDMYEDQKKKNKQVKPTTVCTCQTKNDYILSKNQLKRLQHIDYTINSLQSEQQRLLDEMSTIYDRMMMQKTLIQKVQPSLASKELQQMKDHIETVMENNEKLFEQTYMMKFFEFHNHIKRLDKPEKITQIYNSFNKTLKQSFVGQAIKAAKRIQHDRRFNPERMHDAQVQTNFLTKHKEKDAPKRQSVSSLSGKSPGVASAILAKEKKLNQKMNIEINILQKQNLSLSEELNLYKTAQKEIQIKYRELVQRFQVVQGMYHRTKMQLDDVKKQQQFQMKQLIVENKKLKQQILVLRGKVNYSPSTPTKACAQNDKITRKADSSTQSQNLIAWDQFSGQDKQTQTHDEYLLPANDDQVIKLLKTRNEKALTMLNEKERKIRDTATKITIIENQNIKIKSTLNIFVGIVQEKFIGAKYQPNDLPDTHLKQSILQMNSEQIQTKIKKVIQLIAPNNTHYEMQQNCESQQSTQLKFKKVTSIKPKPIHTLQDEEIDQDNSNQEFSNLQNNENYSKTICNFASDSLDQKKKKRLNVMALLGGKRNYAQTKIHAEIQTQSFSDIRTQRQCSHCGSVQAIYLSNQAHFIHQNQGLLKNSQTKGKCPQTFIDQKKSRGKSRNNSTIRNSVQARNQKYLNGKRSPSNRLKNEGNSSHNSQRIIDSKRKKQGQKINLNTFEKIKINAQGNETDRESFSRSFGRTGLSQYLQAQKKMAETCSMTSKNSPTKNWEIQTQEGFRTPNASELLDNSEGYNKNRIKQYEGKAQSSYDLQLTVASSKINTSLAIKGFNIRQKSTAQKGKHYRVASQIPSTFRPISEATQCDKENQTTFNESYPIQTLPKSFFKNIDNYDHAQFSMASTSPFSKFKIDQVTSPHNIIRKNKTLLLSIQTFRPKDTKTSNMLLERCLGKIINKWGKQKIQQIMNSLLLQTVA